MRHTWRSALLVSSVLFTAGCGALNSGTAPRSVQSQQLAVSSDVKSAFLEAVNENGVRRWEAEEVRVSWEGPQSPEDRRTLEDTIAWFKTINGVPGLVIVSGEAEIVVHRAGRERWSDFIEDTTKHDSADGVTVTEWGASGALKRATIVLDDASPQHQRNRTIVHELIHALGLGHHSCAGGLVYGGGDYSPVWEPGAFDTALVQTLYATELQTGDAPEQVETALNGTATGPACPAVMWQSVTVRDAVEESLWCEVGPDPRTCQRAESSTGPSRDAKVVAWLQQGTVYDHNPTLFTTFRLEGERVLCEKPSGSLRTPCELTDGDTVTVPTMWTDGVELYSTPGE
jgi:hypothetical protein